MRLLLAAALVLPAFGAQAGVVFTSLYSFTGTNDGANPVAGLVQGSDGSFYGTTESGGTNNLGTVFQITTNGTLTSLYSFSGTNDGANPVAGLVKGSDGIFYGTTESGGTNNLGTVFRITTNGTLTSLYSFSGTNDGANPVAGLLQGSDGNFYGTTGPGGTNNLGTVFRITINGTLISLHQFGDFRQGKDPRGALVQGIDGLLYGTTFGGGDYLPPYYYGRGTTFEISTGGVFQTLYVFGQDGPLDYGSNPAAGLVQGSDGNFWGTTTYSKAGYGAVFALTTNGQLHTIYGFIGGDTGFHPNAALVQGSDGNFYGTTSGGGIYSNGTVFQAGYGGLTSLYSFTGTNDGS